MMILYLGAYFHYHYAVGRSGGMDITKCPLSVLIIGQASTGQNSTGQYETRQDLTGHELTL